MPTWNIQDGSDVKAMSEERLRRKLRKGDLTGMELVRAEGDTEWAPLHSLVVFREEVPMVGSDSAAVAARRALVGFGWHLAAFLGVIGWFTLSAGFPFWALFWGIGLALHAMKTLPAVKVALHGAPVAEASRPRVRVPEPTPDPDVPYAHEPEVDPFDWRLERALAALAQAARSVDGPPPDVEGIRDAARALHRRLEALQGAADPAELAELEAERAAAEARLEAAEDARTADAYAAELSALGDRLAAARDIAAAADRLAARERALFHNLAGMRASTLQAAAADTPTPDLAAQAAALRDEARATDEVDEALARARRATQRQRQ